MKSENVADKSSECNVVKKMAVPISADQLVIIGFSTGDNEKILRDFIAANAINYSNAMCNNETLAKYGVNSFPTTL